jgi:hypothetical protein
MEFKRSENLDEARMKTMEVKRRRHARRSRGRGRAARFPDYVDNQLGRRMKLMLLMIMIVMSYFATVWGSGSIDVELWVSEISHREGRR